MEDKIISILNEVDEEIGTYDGENMIEDGIISSFDMLEIITELEKEFHIKIKADYINAHYFANIKSIIEMVKEIADGK